MEKKDKKEKPQSEIEKCKKQAEEYLDGWKRAKADLINYKKRQEEISGEFVKFANGDQGNFSN